MKRLLLLTCAMLVVMTGMAQDIIYPKRGHIDNITDYTEATASNMRRVGVRSTAPLPCTGSPKVPVVLVQFSDLSFTVETTEERVKEFYHKFCNGSGIKGEQYRVSGGIWGSVSDYFIEQSDSLFQPEFEIIGPITLSRSYSYYGQGKKDLTSRRDAFFKEVCQQAVSTQNVDWSVFDNNNDNTVDFIFFIYAGLGENDSNNDDENTIWPHEWTTSKTIENVTFGGYGCTCELVRYGTIRAGVITYEDVSDGIGSMCHELSHGLGLPDLYDVNDGGNFGLDYWDLMDAGCFQIMGNQPCGYSAYERDFMGWRQLQTLTQDEAVTLKLDPIESGGLGYKVLNPANSNEYLILENRQNIGFDTYLGCPMSYIVSRYQAAHGLLITHVDYNKSAWTNNKINASQNHQRMTLVPADGELIPSEDTPAYYLSFRGDPYPGNQGVTELSSKKMYTGGDLTQTITNIVEHEDGTVTVNINKTEEPDGIAGLKTEAASVTGVYSLDGQQQKGLQRGVNIVKYEDGTVKKVLVK